MTIITSSRRRVYKCRLNVRCGRSYQHAHNHTKHETEGFLWKFLSVCAFVIYVLLLLEYNYIIWFPCHTSSATRCCSNRCKDTSQRDCKVYTPYACELDLIWCWDILFGCVNINCDEFFELLYGSPYIFKQNLTAYPLDLSLPLKWSIYGISFQNK